MTKLEQYTRRFLYLYRNGITTSEDLQAHRQGLAAQIAALTEQRHSLYAERKMAAGENQEAALSAQINEKTAALRELRKAKRLCDSIETQAPEVAEKIRQAEAVMHRQKQQEKEDPKKEKFRLQ